MSADNDADGLTQAAAAEIAGATPRTVRDWDRNRPPLYPGRGDRRLFEFWIGLVKMAGGMKRWKTLSRRLSDPGYREKLRTQRRARRSEAAQFGFEGRIRAR